MFIYICMCNGNYNENMVDFYFFLKFEFYILCQN